MLFALIPPPATARAANAEEGDKPGDKAKAGDDADYNAGDGTGAAAVLSRAGASSGGSSRRGRGAR